MSWCLYGSILYCTELTTEEYIILTTYKRTCTHIGISKRVQIADDVAYLLADSEAM